MLLLLATSLLLTPRHPLAEYRLIRNHGGVRTYAFFVNGHKTGMTAEAGDGEFAPTVEVHKTPKGIIYGFTDQTSDGAYIASFDNGFVYRKGKLQWFEDKKVLVAVGEYILFLPTLEGMPPQNFGCAKGTLYCDGKTWDVGYIRRANLTATGVITGWYPMADGKPYENAMYRDTSPTPTPGLDVVFQKRYFRFENGKRVEGETPFES